MPPHGTLGHSTALNQISSKRKKIKKKPIKTSNILSCLSPFTHGRLRHSRTCRRRSFVICTALAPAPLFVFSPGQLSWITSLIPGPSRLASITSHRPRILRAPRSFSNIRLLKVRSANAHHARLIYRSELERTVFQNAILFESV